MFKILLLLTLGVYANVDPSRLEEFKRALITRYGDENTRPNVRSSIELFEKLITDKVDEVTVHCWFELGKIYLFGYNHFLWHRYDIKKSVEYFQKSSDYDHPVSQFMLSLLHSYAFNGGVNVDRSKSLSYLKSSAKMEYIPSMLGLAYRLLYGIDVTKDLNAAISLYKKVFEMISKQDNFHLYITPMEEMRLTKESVGMYRSRMKSDSDIINYWESKTEVDPMAKYELAKAYENNKETRDKALELYKEAATHNVAPAIRDLGLYYINVKKDVKTGIKLLKRALSLGDYESANYLGHLHYKNFKTAIHYFKIAAIHEIPEALYYLGELLLNNSHKLSVASSSEQLGYVYQLYRTSADYGFLLGYWKEAQMLESGIGTTKNLLLAALNYKIVAESHLTINKTLEVFDHFIAKDTHSTLITSLTLAHSGAQVGLWNVLELLKRVRGVFVGVEDVERRMLLELLLQGETTSLYKLGMLESRVNAGMSKYYFLKGFYSGDLDCIDPLVNIFSTDGLKNNAINLLNYKHYRNRIDNNLGTQNNLTYTFKTIVHFGNLISVHIKSMLTNLIRR